MPDALYRAYLLEKDNEGISGSLTLWNDSPFSPYDVGDTFSPIPDGPLLNVKKVSIKDNVIGTEFGKVIRQWQITIDGSTDAVDTSGNSNVRYNFTIEANENSGSMEVTNKGNAPAVQLKVGDKFSIPGIGQVTCSSVKGSDDYDDNGNHVWTVTYDGSTKVSNFNPDTDLPENELTTSYELNGLTVRSVAGEFIVLRKSTSPITKKNIVVYSNSVEPVVTIGATYEGGIAISESVSKVVIKDDDVITNTYYKHDIEVEL